MNIFLVENSNYLRERLSRLVGKRKDVAVIGYAATARDAVEGIRRLKPDVVLLDIRLDQGNGLDVLKQVKRGNDAPVIIVLTNYAYDQYRDRFMSSGADYFFDKSAELDLMLQALESLRYRFQPPAPQDKRNLTDNRMQARADTGSLSSSRMN